MKNKDLSNAIGNINLKYVEEAENFTAKRMSLTKIISLAACIAILVTAIPAALILNREDEKESPVVTTPAVTEIKTPATTDDKTPPQKDPEPYDIIYCGSETDEKSRESLRAAFEELSNTKVEVQEFSWYESSIFFEYEKLEYSEDIPKTLSFTLAGNGYNCIFDYAYNTAAILSTDETLKSHATIARYNVVDSKNNGYKGYVLYQVATKDIVKIEGIAEKIEAEYLPTEVIINLAEDYLTSLYGEDILSEYTFSHSAANWIFYRKYIGEFQTSATIRLNFNNRGELVFLSTSGFRTFDIIKNNVTPKVLLASEAKYQKLSEGQLVSQKRLYMGNDGKPYVSATLAYEKDGKMKVSNLYYRVDTK